jgi:hypothetical protein
MENSDEHVDSHKYFVVGSLSNSAISAEPFIGNAPMSTEYHVYTTPKSYKYICKVHGEVEIDDIWTVNGECFCLICIHKWLKRLFTPVEVFESKAEDISSQFSLTPDTFYFDPRA